MQWFEWPVKRIAVRRLMAAALSMLLLALSAHASAASPYVHIAHCDVNQNSRTIPVQMPSLATSPRDAPVGTPLSNWIYTPLASYYSCQIENSSIAMNFAAVSLTNSGRTANGYTVYNTNVQGVGIAVALGITFDGCGAGTQWTNLGSTWTSCQVSNVHNGNLQGEVSLRLIKTGPITPGRLSGGSLFTVTSPSSGNPIDFSLTGTDIRVPSCQTPDVTVPMGTYAVSAFTGAGSSPPPVNFNLAINNCPAGMTQIQYLFEAPLGATGGVDGVTVLTGDSTAKGIGLRLRDGANAALKFDTAYRLNGYNATTGGSYTVPLKAAYYQTGTSVTPGTANAVITFTMTYQ
jgi:major type 1 subunit fimbrin (pilin)